jgi:CheY-like chemotaxis protein
MPQSLLILVIDDFPVVREMLSASLERVGHRVLCATDGKMGLEILARQPIDLVLTDIIMPKNNGFQFIGEARKYHPTLPIIAISGGGAAMAKSYSLKVAKSLGATMVIKKPFSRQELFHAIEKAMEDGQPGGSADEPHS